MGVFNDLVNLRKELDQLALDDVKRGSRCTPRRSTGPISARREISAETPDSRFGRLDSTAAGGASASGGANKGSHLYTRRYNAGARQSAARRSAGASASLAARGSSSCS